MKLKLKRKTYPGRYPWAVNDRDHAARLARIRIDGHEILELDVDFGLYAAQQALQLRVSERRTFTGMCVPLLFHRAVEMLDAVDALLCAGATLPARPIARAMMEAIVYSRYLSVVNDERVATAFLLTSQLEQLVEMQAAAGRHAPGSRPTIHVREAEARFRAAVGEDRIWREGRRELERIRREEGPAAPWFRVFDGPRTIAAVIRATKFEGELASPGWLFDEWSRTTHSTDWIDAVDLDEHDNPDAVSVLLRPLREVREDADTIAVACHNLFVAGVETLTRYFFSVPDGTAEWFHAVDRLIEASVRRHA